MNYQSYCTAKPGWLVIDPKGFIGDPIYEVAAFIRNPIPELLDSKNAASIIDNRVKRFAEIFEFSLQRIFDWCFVQAVLAWIWVLEDGGDDAYFKNLTEFFEKTTDIKL